VVVWRHGRTAWNLEGRFQGQTDVELDETGVAQAKAAAQVLATLRPDAIVSSDLQRAARTAAELATLTGVEVAYDPGLREADLGSWQGLSRAEVDERYPDEAAAWLRGESIRRGGGETNAEVARRAVTTIEQALEKLASPSTLVVVTPGGAARVAIGRMVGLPEEHWRALGALSNCCWSVLSETSGGWALAEHNAGTLPQPVLSDDR
jgi:broad specificity phosphatase PhoE